MNQVVTDVATVMGFITMVAGAIYFGLCGVLGAVESYKNWRRRVAFRPLAELEQYNFCVNLSLGTAIRHTTQGDEETLTYSGHFSGWVAYRRDWGEYEWQSDPQPTPLAAFAAAELLNWGR